MSELFAEATVRLRPDLTGFITKLREELKTAIGQVETTQPPKVRIGPALTRNFVGELRRLTNDAIVQAQRGLKPIQVRAVLSDTSTAAIARELGRRTQTVRIQGGVTGGIVPELRAATRAGETFAGTQEKINSLVSRGAVLLGDEAKAAATTTRERGRGAAAQKQRVQSQIKDAASVRLLAQATAEQALADQAAISADTRHNTLLAAKQTAMRAATTAQLELNAATTAGTRAAAIRTRDLALEQAANIEKVLLSEAQARKAVAAAAREQNAAVRASATEATRAARSQEQIRRGAFATGLSFLGIRGATLAASRSFLVGAASIAIFAKALQNAGRFTDQINIFRATTQATAEELQRVREAARALGADIKLPGVTAADAAESMTELAKAGLDVQDSIDGARGVLQLATAAAISNAQAVELAANALNAFELAGRDATRVADVFANAANAAQGSIVDIGIAFQQASAAGRQVGLSFEDTTAFLTQLARAGLRGSDAGTSLRTALLRLIRPSEAARERLRALGVEVRDAQGRLRPDVFIQLAEATRNLGPAARDAAIALVGGQDAFRAISILGRQSIKDFIALRRELRQQGTAGELAAARMEGLRGSLEALSNTFSTIGVRVGAGVTPALQSVVDGLTGVTAAMAQSTTVANLFAGLMESINLAMSALSQTLGAIGPVLLPIATAFGQLASSIGVPTILAAVVAFKLFQRAQVALLATTLTTTRALSTFFAVTAGTSAAFRLQAALALLSRSFTLVQLGAAAAAAALVFFLTRESAAERATRRLTEATDALAQSEGRLRSSRRGEERALLGVNTARLALLDAQSAVFSARRDVSNAAEGTFARTRAELQLAVALDNVKIAQIGLRDAIRSANESQAEARQAAINARQRAEDEISAIGAVVAARRREIEIRARAPSQRREEEINAVRDLNAELQDRIRTLNEENTAESRNLARRLQLLGEVSNLLQRLPTPEAIKLTIETQNVSQVMDQLITEFGITGTRMREALVANLSGDLSRDLSRAFKNLTQGIGRDFSRLMGDAGFEGGQNFSHRAALGILIGGARVEAAVNNIVQRARSQLQGLVRQALELEIAGASPEARLANIEQQIAIQQRIVERQRERARENSKASVSLTRALQEQARLEAERRSIEAEIATNAEQAERDLEQKQQDADEAKLGRLERARTRAEQRIADAATTAGLSDDIRRTIGLRRLIHRQINTIRETIQDRQRQIEAIRELQRRERELGREIRELRRQRQLEIAEQIRRGIELDIEFATITENATREASARRRLIANLQKEAAALRAQKRLTLEQKNRLKEIRNEIAEQRKALQEITNERRKMFAEMSFAFLTTQQGFAANLLSNLLPGGAVGGTLGGTTNAPGGRAGSAAAGAREIPMGIRRAEEMDARRTRVNAMLEERTRQMRAEAAGGFTPAQAATLIHLTRQMVKLLGGIEGTTKHPEAKRSSNRNNAAMDGMNNLSGVQA